MNILLQHIKSDLEENNLLNQQTTNGSEEFFVSANPESFRLAAQMFYDVKQVELKDIEKTSV